MKNILLVLTGILVFSINSFSQLPAGWDCNNPVVINSLPFSGIDFDTQILQNIYSAGSCSANQAYMDGKDCIFTFTPITSTYVNITVSNTAQTGVGLFVFSDCPDQTGACVTSNGSFMGTPSLTNVLLTGGVTYYIVVSTNPAVLAGQDYVMFDFSITEAIHDGGIFAINNPVSSCGLSSQESITVQIKNFSSNAISNVQVNYQVNNNSVVTETYSGQIGANGVVNYTFATTADLSLPGSYTIKSYTDLVGDNNAVNDTSIVTVNNSPGDAGISLISSPVTACGLSSGEQITVSITNYSTCTVSNVPVSYIINNGTPVTENYTGTLNPGDVASFTFTTLADLSVAGTYDISCFTLLPGDTIYSNDLTAITIINTHGVSAFPYSENFDNGTTFWVSGGTSPSWQISYPHVKQFMNSVVSDTACMITNGWGDCNTGENSWLESPCFDLSQLVNPTLEMSIWYETGDGGVSFESSIDNGQTWQIVGTNTGAANWYNTQDQWAGSTHKWLFVKRNISEFAGLPNVRFRFVFNCPGGAVDGFAIDNIQIAQCAPMPIASFSYISNGYTVTFENTSTDGTSFSWSFGDGGSSTQVSPTHTYTNGTSFTVKLIVVNSCGTDTIEQNITLDITGSEINLLDKTLKFYPNPAVENISIENNSDFEFVLIVTTLTGQELKLLNIKKGETNLDLKNFSKGVYLLHFNSNKSSIVKRLIVQ